MKTLLAFLLILFYLDGSAQLLDRDLPNSFTYPSVIPYGCLKVVPSVRSAPPSGTFFDSQVLVADNGATGLVRIRAWRIGCHEPNASAIVSAHTSARGTSAPSPASAPQQSTIPRPTGSEAALAPARALGRTPALASARHSQLRTSSA